MKNQPISGKELLPTEIDRELKTRGFMIKEMAPSQIEKAQDLAKRCMSSEYKDC